MQNFFVIEHNYSDSLIYNFKLELKIWKNYSVVKIIIFTDFNFMNYYIMISTSKIL
jgi:hypothetical protein